MKKIWWRNRVLSWRYVSEVIILCFLCSGWWKCDRLNVFIHVRIRGDKSVLFNLEYCDFYNVVFFIVELYCHIRGFIEAAFFTKQRSLLCDLWNDPDWYECRLHRRRNGYQLDHLLKANIAIVIVLQRRYPEKVWTCEGDCEWIAQRWLSTNYAKFPEDT